MASGSPSAAARVTCSPRTVVGVTAGQGHDAVGPTGVGGVAGDATEPAARGEALPAAPPPARAGRAVRVDDHVPGLPGEAGRAPLQHATRHDAAADAGAERDEHHVVGLIAGADPVLGQRRARWRRCRRRPGSPLPWPSRSRTSRSTTPGRFGREPQHAGESTRPATPTPTAARSPSRWRAASARSSATTPAMAATSASAPRGVSTRCRAQRAHGSAGSVTTPRILVPPRSSPATSGSVIGPSLACGCQVTRSVAQERADAPHDVEVGVVDADLDVAATGPGRPRPPPRRCPRPASSRRRSSGTTVRPGRGGRSRRTASPAR